MERARNFLPKKSFRKKFSFQSRFNKNRKKAGKIPPKKAKKPLTFPQLGVINFLKLLPEGKDAHT
jgi:hypothetical protein